MTITPVDSTATSLYASAATTAGSQTLDSKAFLTLLVAQLRAQDPSSPMDTNEMMAQTTQLAAMEQLTTLSGLTEESFSLQMRVAASALLGSRVSYADAEGALQTGSVTAVSFADQVPTITVNGTTLRLDAISGVSQATGI